MIPSREQLIEALYREYDYLCHDDFDPDFFYSPINHPRHKSEMTQKSLKMIQDWIKKDPVMVIDLNTLKLRPPKYK